MTDRQEDPGLAGTRPAAGQPAPDFQLRDHHGQPVRLAELRGRPVLLVFYPFAFSRVCTGELRSISEHLPRPAYDRAALLAISCDPMFALRAFAEQGRLDLPLLSDFWPHGAVSRAYGVFDVERGCSTRSTFLIDGERILRWSVHNAMPDARDVEAYARALAALPD